MFKILILVAFIMNTGSLYVIFKNRKVNKDFIYIVYSGIILTSIGSILSGMTILSIIMYNVK